MKRNIPKTNEELQEYKKENAITVEMICGSIKTFVENLPYSIDPLSTKFVSAILYQVIPANGEQYDWFMEDEHSTLFKKLKEWGDTRKTAYSILICAILQEMLVKNSTEMVEQITKQKMEEMEVWGLNHADSTIMKQTILALPRFFEIITSANSVFEREQAVAAIYDKIKENFGKFSLRMDLEMFYYTLRLDWDSYKVSDASENYLDNVESLLNSSKEEIVKKIK